MTKISSIFHSVKKYVIAHKVISGIVSIALIYSVYWVYGYYSNIKATETRYVLSQVSTSTVLSTVTGTGQITVSNQLDVKSKVSGEVLSVYVSPGDKVNAGDLMMHLDSTDAEKTLRDAKISLQSAQIALQKLVAPADNLTLLQAQNNVSKANQTKVDAVSALAKSYDDGFNITANTFLDLPNVMSGLQSILYSSTQGLSTGGQWNIDYYATVAALYDSRATGYKDDTDAKYQAAFSAYNQNYTDFKASSRFSGATTTENLINETYNTTKLIAEAVKSSTNLIQFYQDQLTAHNLKSVSQVTTALSNLNNYTSLTNSDLLNLFGAKSSIQNNKDSVINADQQIAESNISLTKTETGADPLDIQTNKLSLLQRQNAVDDAQTNIYNYYIRAPFSGIIAAVNFKKMETVGSGSAVVTLISDEKFAQTTLNEVDASKVKVGDKATLTFDAIDGLTISGSVAEIDPLGTVSQGVVTYNVKIKMDTQDDRIKSGMSFSATIITDTAIGVLTVPASAVKTNGSGSYVQVFNQNDLNGVDMATAMSNTGIPMNVTPGQKTVMVGLSDDTSVEIKSGLNGGDYVISKTITASKTTTKATTATSLLGGTRTGGGGTFRAN